MTKCGPFHVSSPSRSPPVGVRAPTDLGGKPAWRWAATDVRAAPRGRPPCASRAQRPSSGPRYIPRPHRGAVVTLKRSFDADEMAPRIALNKRFSVLHFSVQSDHLHVIVEAGDKAVLSRGVIGLLVRVARAINRSLH